MGTGGIRTPKRGLREGKEEVHSTSTIDTYVKIGVHDAKETPAGAKKVVIKTSQPQRLEIQAPPNQPPPHKKMLIYPQKMKKRLHRKT